MSDVVISVEDLSKHYRLGQIGGGTLQEDFERWWARVRGRQDPLMKVVGVGPTSGDLWALRNVSFEVRQGEVLGIIGRNGAGKSTLLKILSRTTAPTKGRVRIKGRIASLLEVGTGFHPELTGRENIFLNGAILGMKKAEIARKLDEIVAFSGIERFIDTPVKRYSSGMYVRLGFSVAAYLQSEILVIDEVLAVGDAEFQKRCLGKLGELSGSGRTVLFVSHSLSTLTTLCPMGMLLDEGKVRAAGKMSSVLPVYMSTNNRTSCEVSFPDSDQTEAGDSLARLLWARIEDIEGRPCPSPRIDTPFNIRFRYRVVEGSKISPYPNIHLRDGTGRTVFFSAANRRNIPGASPGSYEACCSIPGNLLTNSTYFVSIALTFTDRRGGSDAHHVSFFAEDCLLFVVDECLEQTLEETRNGYSGELPGVVRPILEWQVAEVE